MNLEREQLVDLYRQMARIREFEEKMGIEFKEGRLKGFLHSGVGEEATMAGVLVQARITDQMVATHRGHGAVLVKGAEPKKMFAELGGRLAGLCKGRGGSMHMGDFKKGILGTNGILGAGVPIASGVGLALKKQKRDDVCFCYFGDGQSNEGGIHEGMNFAAAFKLPVVFICTNNGMGQFTRTKEVSNNVDVAARGTGYGIPSATIDGNDVLAVYEAAAAAIERARTGGGPSLLELKTFRYNGHTMGVAEMRRTREEIEDWRNNRDPIDRYAAYLQEQNVATADELKNIYEAATQEMLDAFNWAMEQPEPPESEAYADVYTNLVVEGRAI